MAEDAREAMNHLVPDRRETTEDIKRFVSSLEKKKPSMRVIPNKVKKALRDIDGDLPTHQ